MIIVMAPRSWGPTPFAEKRGGEVSYGMPPLEARAGQKVELIVILIQESDKD
jgi:hypothetical protein